MAMNGNELNITLDNALTQVDEVFRKGKPMVQVDACNKDRRFIDFRVTETCDLHRLTFLTTVFYGEVFAHTFELYWVRDTRKGQYDKLHVYGLVNVLRWVKAMFRTV